MKKKTKGGSWRTAKTVLADKSKAELLKLISDLYASSSDNKNFIHAKCGVGSSGIEEYKKIISDSVCPDVYNNKTIKLSVGKKAITDYFKATKNENGKLELMVHYLESGNQFTLDFGDIDERFYLSLESMFSNILSLLEKQNDKTQLNILTRLREVVSSSQNIGWGYHDSIGDLLAGYEN